MAKKVLIIDDLPMIHGMISYELAWKNVICISASTKVQAQELFALHEDIDLIVIDACLEGEQPDSMDLVVMLRELYKGPMLAISQIADYNNILMHYGCNHQAKKADVSKAIINILAL